MYGVLKYYTEYPPYDKPFSTSPPRYGVRSRIWMDVWDRTSLDDVLSRRDGKCPLFWNVFFISILLFPFYFIRFYGVLRILCL
ncbi:hypothetical protein P168DRAFT_117306 [Aspergillus campestris IBT 28561]|uniref:Uncharacterized protein n=1 Tax=Aspergillus campestris (strain IBT 28561) TaxID=1392248 RepID=A0A2I1D9X9_ASPC2|nr:uncharacterized protein P168DRAFT_117306 [Aspergillus campestris IBT 28561]PKY06690.1 hypothetical protein P168DRAFT_117306 [Aspergillus campestris IBT 28561]